MMKRVRIILAAAALAFAGSTADAKAAGAAEAVQTVYVQHIKDARADKGEEAEFALGDAAFSASLKTLWAKYEALAASPDRELGAIDYDIFFLTQADQDVDLIEKTLKVDAKETGDKAAVTVTMNRWDGDAGASLTYSMVNEGGAWKIDDINYGPNTLRGDLTSETAPH